MDYLERLDKALEALEKEADRMTGLAKLSNTLGEFADELSAEKRQIKDATQDLRIATETIEKNIKNLLTQYKEAEELSEKRLNEIKGNFGEVKGNLSEVKDNIENTRKTILDRTELVDKHIDESQIAIEKHLESQLKDVKADIDKNLKDLTDKVDTSISNIGFIRDEIETFRASNEKTEKLHTILIAIAVFLSLLSCCLPFFQ